MIDQKEGIWWHVDECYCIWQSISERTHEKPFSYIDIPLCKWWKHKRSSCQLGSSTLPEDKAPTSKKGNENWWEAMCDEYWKAAVTDVKTLEAMDSWEVIKCSEDMNVLQSTWAFKLKHFPDGLIKKL